MNSDLYNSAAKIISVTSSFKEDLIKRGIDKDKIEIIYNGVSLDMFNTPSEISDPALSEYLENGFKVGYIGTIGMAHSIITLIDAAEKLKDTESKICCSRFRCGKRKTGKGNNR